MLLSGTKQQIQAGRASPSREAKQRQNLTKQKQGLSMETGLNGQASKAVGTALQTHKDTTSTAAKRQGNFKYD